MTTSPLVVVAVGSFVAALSTSLVAISAPVIAEDLAVSASDVSFILTAYLLAVTSLLALAGKIADVFGQRRVYLTGLFIFALGAVASAAAPSLIALIAARIAQGAGAAMLMAVGPAIVVNAVAPERRARGLGTQLMATYLGLTLGPAAGGMLSSVIGWQAVFAVIAAASAPTFAFAWRHLPRDEAKGRPPKASDIDFVGAALLALGLVATLVVLDRVKDPDFGGPRQLWLVGVAVIGLLLFIARQRRHSSPLLPLGLLRAPPFAFAILGATLLYTTSFMLAYLLPFELQHGAGLTPAMAGAFMTAQPATMALVAPLSGIVSDRWGPKLPSTLGMLVISVGLLGVASATDEPGAALLLSLALVGVGAGFYVAPNSSVIMGAAPRGQQGVAGSMAATARNLGMALGIALAATLYEPVGFRGAVWVAAALATAGTLLGLLRPPSG